MSSAASLPAVKSASKGGIGERATPKFRTSASSPKVQIKALQDKKGAAAMRKSVREQKQKAAKDRKAAMEQEYEKALADKLEQKRVKLENFRHRQERTKMQEDWLKIVAHMRWVCEVHRRYVDEHDTLQAAQKLTRTARKSMARSALKQKTRREIVISRLNWWFRLQVRVKQRKINADIIRKVVRAGLCGPGWDPPDPEVAAAAAAAAERDVLAGGLIASPAQLEYTFRMSILKLPIAVVKAQRLARGFIACKRARLQSMYLLRQHIRRRQRLMAQRALESAAAGDDGDDGLGDVHSTKGKGRGRGRAASRLGSKVGSRVASRGPSRANSRPGSPRSGSSTPGGGHKDEQLDSMQRRLRAMNARVLKSIRHIEAKHNLQSVPVGDPEEEDDDGTPGGRQRALVARRLSQINCLSELEEELERRRKAHIVGASVSHELAIEEFKAQLSGGAHIDTHKMSQILRLSPKKSMHRQLMRRASTLPMPRWPTFTLYTGMVADKEQWLPSVMTIKETDSASSSLAPSRPGGGAGD